MKKLKKKSKKIINKELAKYYNRSKVLIGELFYYQSIKLLNSKKTDALIFSNKDTINAGVIRRFWLIMPDGTYKILLVNNEVKLLLLRNNKIYNLRTFKNNKNDKDNFKATI